MRHGKRWGGGRPWEHGPGQGEWPPKWGRNRRFLFARFLGIFGFMMVLLLGTMAALAFLVTKLVGGSGQTAVLVWIVSIGLLFGLPMLAIRMAFRAFRGIAAPLADVMSAADAVASGDMTARVPEERRGEFGQLARSFNRMVSELERNDRQRRNLAADVAHELRTPLHVIQGNLEGALDGVYEATPEHLSATLDETRLLARLVEDLRTLSLAEAGELPLQRESVSLRELLTDISTSFSGQAEAAGVELRVEAGDADPTVDADVGRMHQVLGNLVVNALRHTPRGGSVALQATRDDDGATVIVRDTGEGISADDLPNIFDRFWRGDRSRGRDGAVGGGLGLPIARQLARAHGGTVDVESELGVGTTFTLRLPAVKG